MEKLEKLHPGAQVTIILPDKWAAMQLDGEVSIDWDFPFSGYADQEKAFWQLMGTKSFLILRDTRTHWKKKSDKR